MVPARMARLPGADWSARTLDAFLTELDAGGSLPDAVLAFGGDEIIRALRSHDRTCALPVYLFAAADQPVPAGWDGVWSGENFDALSSVPERATWCGALPAPTAPLDSARREHRFARWLAARGDCQLADPEVFGVDAPRATLKAWRARGWVTAPADENGRWQARALLRAAARQSSLVLPEPLHSSLPGTASAAAPLATPALLPRAGLLALSAFLVALAALVWSGEAAWRGSDALNPTAGMRSPNLRIGEPRSESAALKRPEILSSDTDSPRRMGVAIPEAPAAAPPPPAAARLIARGVVRRESSALRSLSPGRVAALLVEPGAQLQSGSPLARLIDPRAERDVARLEQDLREVDAALETSSRDDEEARAQFWTQSERERERMSNDLARSAQSAAQAQDHYTRSLRLAEEGVISFREVRPDWNALQRAREAETRDRELLDDFIAARALSLANVRGEAPAWLVARRTRVEDELRTARSMAAPRLVRASEAGELIGWLVTVGMDVEEGIELARIASGEPWVEAQLESGERSTVSTIGEVEMRFDAGDAWVLVTEFHEVLSPGSGALLRARVPPDLRDATPPGGAAELRFRYLD